MTRPRVHFWFLGGGALPPPLFLAEELRVRLSLLKQRDRTHKQHPTSLLLQISIELNFFTKYQDFFPCKKSLLDVKNLTVAFTIGISKRRSLAFHPTPLLLPPVAATIVEEDCCCCPPLLRTTVGHLRLSRVVVAGCGRASLFGSRRRSLLLPLCVPLLAVVQALMIFVDWISPDTAHAFDYASFTPKQCFVAEV
jgi:hypothetical protein